MAKRKKNDDALVAAEQWSKGLGTSTKQQPISVKFPPQVDALLRAMSDRSGFIRSAVIEKLKRDGLLPDAKDGSIDTD